MILSYVYKLTHRETGEFYIGFRKSNKIKSELDLGFKYFSSSKHVKKLGFENFNIEIIAEFFKWEDAYEFEQELIKENWNNPLILNKHYFKNNSSIFKMNSKNHPNYKKPLSEETKRKIGEKNKISLKGKKLSDITKEKIRVASKGKNNHFYGKRHSENTRNKIRIKNSGNNHPMYGKHLSEITKEKLKILNSGINNPMYGKHLSDETKKKIGSKIKKFSQTEEIEICILHIAGFSLKEIHMLYNKASTKTIRKTFNKIKNKWQL